MLSNPKYLPICNKCRKRQICEYTYLELLFCSKTCIQDFKNKIPIIEVGLKVLDSEIIEVFSKTDTMRRIKQHVKLLCVCGNQFKRRADFVKKRVAQNKIISCGCKTVYNIPGKENSKWSGIGDLSGAYFSSIKCKAKNKNIEFTVTKQYLWNLFLQQDKKCALSKITLIFAISRKFDVGQTASLDRIDPNKGYIRDNLQWVHKDINYMKRTYSQDHFIKMCKLVAKNT